MTQNIPSERALSALKASGMGQAPLMSLEREDALFVLTDDMLVYQDGGGTRRVTLRDLTRIHSDQAGLLRVETPAGTALTASLLGFDVGQVQGFFKGVRSATARAKDLPAAPTPTPGAAKTFGSAPTNGTTTNGTNGPSGAQLDPAQSKTDQKESTGAVGPAEHEKAAVQTPAPDTAVARSDGPLPATAPKPVDPAPDAKTDGAEAPTAAPQTPAPSPAEPRTPVPAVQTHQQSASEDAAGKGGLGASASGPGSSPPSTVTDAAAMPAPKPPTAGLTDSKSAEARKSEGHAENPVVISSSSFSPTVSKPGLGAIGADSGAVGKLNVPPARAGTLGPEKSGLEKAGAGKSGAEQSSAALKMPKPELGKEATPRPEAPNLNLPKTDGATATADPTAARIELPHRPTPRSPVSVPGAAGPAETQDSSALPPLPAADLTPAAAPPTTALSRVAAATALARQAETVDALAGRLKLLGAVLFVGALALAYFQFTGGQALAGIWTLLSGGVGAFALLALGELSGLLSLLARAKND